MYVLCIVNNPKEENDKDNDKGEDDVNEVIPENKRRKMLLSES